MSHPSKPIGRTIAFICLYALVSVPMHAQQSPSVGAVIVHSALGGFIFGYDIDRTGTEGLLAESIHSGSNKFNVAVETFDQRTGKILKIVAEQKNTDNDYVSLGIFGNSVGLAEEEISSGIFVDKRIYGMMNPLDGNKLTAKWTPPFTKDDVILSVPMSQGSPNAAIFYFNNAGSVNSKVLGTNVASDTFGTPIVLTDSIFDFNDSPVMTYDSVNNQSIVAASIGGPVSIPKLAQVDLATGNVFEFQGVGFGFVNGIAMDALTGIVCTSTEIDFSLEFYNLATHTGFVVPLHNATSQLYRGGDVEFDPVHKLFLVGQEFSSTAPQGSSIQVFDEQGNFLEAVNGLTLPASPAYMALHPSERSGYVIVTQTLNTLESFTY